MPSCQITKKLGKPKADKAGQIHKHESTPRACDQTHNQIAFHMHTIPKPNRRLAHQTLFNLATTHPKYKPLSNADSPDNNTNHCLFRTSADNNCDYCQHYLKQNTYYILNNVISIASRANQPENVPTARYRARLAHSSHFRLSMMMITVYFSYHMKPKPKAIIAKSVSIVSPMINIRS